MSRVSVVCHHQASWRCFRQSYISELVFWAICIKNSCLWTQVLKQANLSDYHWNFLTLRESRKSRKHRSSMKILLSNMVQWGRMWCDLKKKLSSNLQILHWAHRKEDFKIHLSIHPSLMTPLEIICSLRFSKNSTFHQRTISS